MDTTTFLVMLDVVMTLVFILVLLNYGKQLEKQTKTLSATLSGEIGAALESFSPSQQLDFDKVVALFVSMSDKAKATFLYRIVEALDQDHITTVESYISLKLRKKSDNKVATEQAREERKRKQ